MADKIRIGIVGANAERGSWGARAHIPALKALPDYELKAICTAHEDTAEAARRAFGAELAFHDLATMLQHPDIDLVAVCVRVPLHKELVMQVIQAGKDVFCEWPLGANTDEAVEMAEAARSAGVRSLVGLQARSDPAMEYLKALLAEGYVGDVLACNMTSFGGGILERPMDRTWQADASLGGNTLTISAGHAIDAMCFAAGDFVKLSADLSTQVKQWRATDTGAMVDVTSPDNIILNGTLDSGAVASVHVGSLPFNGSGWRMDVYGRDGTILATSGPNGSRQLMGSRGAGALADLPVPDKFVVVPEGTPKGGPYNVAQAYVHYADAVKSGASVEPDFDHAVKLHRFMDAMRRSSEEGRSVEV